MEIILDTSLKFPFDHPDYEKRYEKLYVFCNGVEGFEKNFGIELSCGDGKFLSDVDHDDSELEKYDGNVDLSFPPRFFETKELLKRSKPYRFTIKVDKNDNLRYFLNSKEVKSEYF